MAGLLAAIADAAAPDEALAAATAAATASVTSRLAGALHQSDLAAIRPRVAVGRLPAA
jgi:fructose-1-phosphate kinase PfkB-like protein